MHAEVQRLDLKPKKLKIDPLTSFSVKSSSIIKQVLLKTPYCNNFLLEGNPLLISLAELPKGINRVVCLSQSNGFDAHYITVHFITLSRKGLKYNALNKMKLHQYN